MKRTPAEKKHTDSKHTKSDFVFLETDNGQKMAIYYRDRLNDYCIISELNFADLLHKNH